ncbi:hypothetical protein M2325_000687 [Methanococcus voltae PS]|uniref:Uncharacterized protein n=1 Tax=Methanococcus voltae PS TaxID=523842 RepID=A0ABT2EVP4_METVO|nr:hypothetical protein [Methanococcus voltae PS]
MNEVNKMVSLKDLKDLLWGDNHESICCFKNN